MRALIASFVVATGQVVWNLGQTRTSEDCRHPSGHVVQQLPAMQRYDWVVDNLNTHWSLEVCRLVAQWCKVPLERRTCSCGVQRRAFLSDPSPQHVFHLTPKQGSWLVRDHRVATRGRRRSWRLASLAPRAFSSGPDLISPL